MSTASKAPLIVENERGTCIAGTRTTVYSVMDYVVAGHDREYTLRFLPITAEQLEAAYEYIEQHRAEVESNYARILQREEEARLRSEQLVRERSPFPPDMPLEEREARLRQRFAELKQATQQSHDNNHSRG